MARQHKTKKGKERQWLVLGGVALCFLGAIGFLLKVVLSGPGTPAKKQPQVITLIKPPPEVKEKPPEPEVPKEAPKQAMETPNQAPTPQNQPQDQADDSPPAGDNLAVDGDGAAGDNAFGLGAKKGGRALTLGGPGGGGGPNGLNRLSLLSKYGGYAQQMQADIERRVKQALDESGGRPKGKQNTLVKLTLSPEGRVTRFAIVASSGIDRLDSAFKAALTGLKMSERPPDGMPSSMTLRITTHG
jgi:periplasmic protein TonB